MKFFYALLFLSTLAWAELVNGVALTVNEDPITLYEIKRLAKQQNIPENKAVYELIKQVISKQVAKARNIVIEKREIEMQIDAIITKNRLTKDEFEQKLKLEGLTYDDYFEQMQMQQLMQRLVGSLTFNKVNDPTDQEMQTFFELHKDEFSLPQSIEITQYRSANPNSLAAIQKSPLFSPTDVQIHDETIDPKQTNPRLAEILMKTKERSFTQILPLGQGSYAMFYVKKFGKRQVPQLDEIKKELSRIIQTEKRNTIITNFFQDEIRKAKINYIRIKKLEL